MMARDQTSPPKHLKLFLKVTRTLLPLFVGVCAIWRTSDWLAVLYLQEFDWMGRLSCGVSHALDIGSCFWLFILAVRSLVG